MNECIINDKCICPYESISGKICTYCKIPDIKIINEDE